jgi:photoactive yellow protein
MRTRNYRHYGGTVAAVARPRANSCLLGRTLSVSPWSLTSTVLPHHKGQQMSDTFDYPGLLERLEASDDVALDALPFGVVAMAEDGTVTSYNLAESRLSGLTPANVVGRHFFTNVAPCTNNFMVAYRFETEPVLDDVIDYVFTLGMQPTAVRLRLLKQPARRRMYLIVERK